MREEQESASSESNAPIKRKGLAHIGVQQAETHYHEINRIIIIVFIFTTIVLACIYEKYEEMDIKDYHDVVKEGTILYRGLMDMDPATRQVYLHAMKPLLQNQVPFYIRYMREIRTPLVAGFVAEYLVNGNTTKPMTSIARSFFYSNIYTLFMLLTD